MASSSATGGEYRFNNNNDAMVMDHDTDDHSDVDAYLAREAQKKQTAPIECIDMFIKTTTNYGNDNNNNNSKKGSFSKRQQHQQHPVDDEELSVLTMEPALQAISRREAEGLITYPSLSQHRRENNNKTNNKKKHLSAMEEEEDHDDDDDYMVDDLSEIAPLDLVSL
jgi:hypothetical protein